MGNSKWKTTVTRQSIIEEEIINNKIENLQGCFGVLV